MIDKITQFNNGVKACKQGKPCPQGASEEFIHGYAEQYQKEAIAGGQNGRK